MSHSKDMVSLVAVEDRPTVNRHGTATLLVKQPGSEMAHALERGLRAAGVPLTVAANPYDAVTEAARADPSPAYLLVGVDFFDAEALRLLPLFRREWPDTTIVAYHSPGFEHKGRLAGIVGADVVVSRPEQLLTFLGEVSREPRARPPAPSRAPTTRPAVPPPAPAAEPAPPPALAESPSAAAPPPAPAAPDTPGAPLSDLPPQPQPSETTGPTPSAAPQPSEARRPTAPSGPAERPARRPPAPAAASAPADSDVTPFVPPPAVDETENFDGDEALAEGRVIGTVELTDEELRILLGEDNDT